MPKTNVKKDQPTAVETAMSDLAAAQALLDERQHQLDEMRRRSVEDPTVIGSDLMLVQADVDLLRLRVQGRQDALDEARAQAEQEASEAIANLIAEAFDDDKLDQARERATDAIATALKEYEAARRAANATLDECLTMAQSADLTARSPGRVRLGEGQRPRSLKVDGKHRQRLRGTDPVKDLLKDAVTRAGYWFNGGFRLAER